MIQDFSSGSNLPAEKEQRERGYHGRIVKIRLQVYQWL